MTRCRRTIAAVLLGAVLSTAAADVTLAAPTASTYTVKAGDGLVNIALKLKVSLNDLLTANKLTTKSVIWPGMTLVVPGSAPSTTVPAPTTTAPKAAQQYTVQAGDSLLVLANRMKVAVKDLLAANKITLQSVIWPGMRLTVPTGGVMPAAPKPTAPSTTVPAPTTTAPKAAQQYTVQAGDSLLVLANRMKVAVKDLLAANKITLQSVIWPGMRLTVPTGGVMPAAPKPTAPSTTVPAPTTTAPSSTAATTTTVAVASRPPAPMVPVPPTDGLSAPVKAIVDFAIAQLGKPYKAYTAGPDSYDCSGLTMMAFAAARIRLPHQSGQQMQLGTIVDWTTEPIKAGDLVFLETSVGSGIIGHVGVATGPKTWIHAPRTGDVVRSSNIPFVRVVGVRRYVQP